MISQSLTRDEWRAIGIGTLAASCAAVATGLITWGFEEAKRALAAHRESTAKHTPPETSSEPPV